MGSVHGNVNTSSGSDLKNKIIGPRTSQPSVDNSGEESLVLWYGK